MQALGHIQPSFCVVKIFFFPAVIRKNLHRGENGAVNRDGNIANTSQPPYIRNAQKSTWPSAIHYKDTYSY